MKQNKFFICTLNDNRVLAWSSARGKYSHMLVYGEIFKSYQDFKITNNVYKLTDKHEVIRLKQNKKNTNTIKD